MTFDPGHDHEWRTRYKRDIGERWDYFVGMGCDCGMVLTEDALEEIVNDPQCVDLASACATEENDEND